jgi:hypothetical protein
MEQPRFRAMVGALGGDLSSLNVNPAGSAILTIRHSSNNDIKNNSNYFGTATTEK